MRRRELVLGLTAGAAAFRPLASLAQERKLPAIGVLVIGGPLYRSRFNTFRDELDELGHTDREDIRIEVRSADGNIARLPELAAQLVRDKVDILVAYGTPSVLAAQQATSDIPIVMVGPPDPVGAGFVASFARPGGNITGLAVLAQMLTEKNVELLKEALPDLGRIAALCNSADPFSKLMLEHARLAGDAQKLEVVPFMITAGAELDAAFPAMLDRKIQAVIVQPTLPVQRVAELAIRDRLSTAAPSPDFTATGGLMSYAALPEDVDRGAAAFVDKILRGAKPADLPVEQPTRFELAVNLKTAEALGVSLPASILARADEVIE
jgi:putative ABC transport system substrate-binding protein